MGSHSHPKAHTIASHSDTTATGAELETLTDGSETALHSHAADGGIWTLLETLSPSSDTSITSSTLAAHDLFMLIIDFGTDTGGAVEVEVELRLNEDANALYGWRVADGNAVASSTGENEMRIGSTYRHAAIVTNFLAQILVQGKGTYGHAVIGSSGTNYITSFDSFINGNYESSDDIVNFTILSAAFTGKIKIYGMDY